MAWRKRIDVPIDGWTISSRSSSAQSRSSVSLSLFNTCKATSTSTSLPRTLSAWAHSFALEERRLRRHGSPLHALRHKVILSSSTQRSVRARTSRRPPVGLLDDGGTARPAATLMYHRHFGARRGAVADRGGDVRALQGTPSSVAAAYRGARRVLGHQPIRRFFRVEEMQASITTSVGVPPSLRRVPPGHVDLGWSTGPIAMLGADLAAAGAQRSFLEMPIPAPPALVTSSSVSASLSVRLPG